MASKPRHREQDKTYRCPDCVCGNRIGIGFNGFQIVTCHTCDGFGRLTEAQMAAREAKRLGEVDGEGVGDA